MMRWLADMIEALAIEDNCGELNVIQCRGVSIAARLRVRQSKHGRYLVASDSDSGDEYRTTDNGCSCPFDGHCCKHQYAAKYTNLLAVELMRRLDVSGKWRGDWDELQSLVQRYEQLLSSARYVEPADKMLTGFQMEAIGDDSFHRRNLGGVQKLRDIRAPRPWVARITGLCPRYEFRRDFAKPCKDYRLANKSGSRGVWWYYQLREGIYDINQPTKYTDAKRYFARVGSGSVVEIEHKEVVKCLSQSE